MPEKNGSPAASPRYIAHVVSQTHWDREWYRTFQQFRMRLVAMTDALLSLLERDPDYKAFYWDGQTSVIEDYLEIRPENAERLRTHFTSGRLYTGPWFVQPDEFLVSGESFVRNLIVGRAMCAEWGTGAAVGYAPDAFGHTSQMPQILQGFGIDNAVLFRGITTDQVDTLFRWQASDGTGILCAKMPDDNAYSNFYYHFQKTLAETKDGVPPDPEQVVEEATALLADCIAERPVTHQLLWMDGVDHIYAQPRTPAILDIVNARLGDRVEARHSTLPDFLAAVRDAAPELQTVRGELRHSNRHWRLQALLAHVASSRIHLKQLNHRCETLLERWAEPFSALAWLHGADYPTAYLRYAWKQLLLNHPHDSLCGCSIDQVHRDMLPRFEQCRQVGEELVRNALNYFTTSITTQPAGNSEPLAALVVYNPLGWTRREVIETVIELPQEKAPNAVQIVDRNGVVIPCALESLSSAGLLHQPPYDIPRTVRCKRWRVRFIAETPPFGYTTYYAVGAEPNRLEHLPPPDMEVTDNRLENGHLRVEVAANGSLKITHKATGQTFSNLLLFEDGGDFGDGWNYRKPKDDLVLTTIGEEAQFDWGASNAAEGRLRYRLSWDLPVRRPADDASRKRLEQIFLEVTLTLTAESERLDVHLDVHNYARDHRLRVLFPSGVLKAKEYAVEQAFDVVNRTVELPEAPGWKEPPPGTGPQKSFVDVSDEAGGLCLINVGTPEVEVKDDTERTIALTLLRAFGQGVGTPEDQQEGQMQGSLAFDMSLLPHAGDWLAAQVWQAAHNRNVPLRAVQTDLHAGALPSTGSLLEFSGETLIPTAIKRSEAGDALVFRAVNYGSETTTLNLKTEGVALSAQTARLDETPLETVSVEGGGVSLDVPTRRIATLLLKPETRG